MIKAIDFFCGAGGLTRGLLNAGIHVLAGIDSDERLRETYEHNNTPSRFVCSDIRKLKILDLHRELNIVQDDILVYAACTPCQPFSTLNQMKGRDDRKDLLLSFAKIVQEAPPDFIVVENVPGLNTAYGKDIYEKFMDVLLECKFIHSTADFLDAQNFGVPQVRKRFILLASRHGEIHFPVRSTEKPPSIDSYISKYPPIKDGEKSDTFYNHEARRLPPHHKTIVQAVPRDGGSRKDVADTSILLKCHRDNPNVHKDVFGRMTWSKPAPTLTCRCTDVYCGRFTHPSQDRGLSLREAAALQTFDDDYKFFGTFFHIAKQIGNAVPVKLAQQLGESITSVASTVQREEL